MRVDRSPDRPVHHLEWRVRLMGVGAVLALAGMYFEAGWMVNVAIVVLLTGFGLRFLPRPREGGESEPADPGRRADRAGEGEGGGEAAEGDGEAPRREDD